MDGPAIRFFVYELRDPRPEIRHPETLADLAPDLDPRAFYVGKSKSSQDRLRQHIYEARRTGKTLCLCHKCGVIRGILAAGMVPYLACMAEFPTEAEALTVEPVYAARFPKGRLTNLAEPGESGWSHSFETRLKMKNSRLGRRLAPTTREKVARANRERRPLGIAGREKVVAGLRRGKTPRDLALVFPISQKMIELIRRAEIAAGRLPPLPDQVSRENQMIAKIETGATVDELAVEFSLTENGVYSAVYRLASAGRIPPFHTLKRGSRRRGRRAADILRALRMYAAGQRTVDIATTMGVEASKPRRLRRDGVKLAASMDAGISAKTLASEFNTTPAMALEIREAALRLPTASKNRLLKLVQADQSKSPCFGVPESTQNEDSPQDRHNRAESRSRPTRLP